MTSHSIVSLFRRKEKLFIIIYEGSVRDMPDMIISVLELIWQIIATIYGEFMNHLWFWNALLAIVIVFLQRRDPKSVWTWLLVLYFIPLLGFILYLLLGQDMRKLKMFRLKEIEDSLNSQIQKQEETIIRNEFNLSDGISADYNDLVLYNLEALQAAYSDDNEVTVYTDGNEKFDALIEAIDSAEKFIHIQYYIIKKDILFERIVKHLEKKVKEGVEVRVLCDGMGGRTVRESYWRELRKKGIQVAIFFPPLLKRLQLRVNYRNHRKIAVIDGKTAFVGGFNIGKEYIGLDKKFGYWRDTHLKIEGSAVSQLQIRFILDWNYAAKDDLFLREEFFPQNQGKGNVGIQIISSGPDSKYQEIRDNYLRLINKAKKNIYIQTPYFIPDEAVMTALRMAAMSGVEVKLMIPCKPDHPFVYWATYSYVGELLAAGAKCYTYDNGFLHAKGLMVDGMVSSYGTANWDMRSFYLNFEVNAVLYNAEVTKELEDIFLADLGKSTEITPYDYSRRRLIIRLKEQVSRLLSPLL